ncbi:NHL repeat protein, partial [Candidatus Magnetomorum sp. HK-1]
DDYLLSLCSGDQYSIVATPALNQYGTAVISITITDGESLASSTSFNLTVTDVDDSIYMWANFQAAESVLGQTDFSSNATGTTDSLMDHPAHVAVDPISGKVFVSDLSNHRILRFSAADSLINGSSAEAVFGQANFVSGLANRGGGVAANTLYEPTGIYVDSFGRLWVAEFSNHRVLRFDNASYKTTGANADAVLGQPDFNSNSSSTTQNGMKRPIGVWIDYAGNLWVSDYLNKRILRFNDAARKSNGANADAVLGQTNYTSATSGTTQSSFSAPKLVFG